MKKKICFFAGNMNNAGGTERVCSIIANELDNAGYEIVIISISEGMQPFFSLNKDIKIRSLFPKPGRALYRTPALIYKLRKFFIKEKIETLIVVETMSVLFTLPAVQGLAIDHICWEHFNFDEDLGKKGRRVARQLAAKYCDTVVTLTDRDKQKWLQVTKNKNKIISIPNPSPFIPQSCEKEESTKTVLAVGRLTYQKGFDLLLKVWIEVHHQFPDWRLTIVGEGEDRDQLESFINISNLSSSVNLVGNVTNIDSYYSNAEIFCLSSRYEGFGMVLVEALAFGLPIVSFDCELGPAEILEGTGSILVPANDTNLFANELIKLIKDREKRNQIKSLSLKKAETFQPDIIIQKWINLIEFS